jgi:hypothetical protein
MYINLRMAGMLLREKTVCTAENVLNAALLMPWRFLGRVKAYRKLWEKYCVTRSFMQLPEAA